MIDETLVFRIKIWWVVFFFNLREKIIAWTRIRTGVSSSTRWLSNPATQTNHSAKLELFVWVAQLVRTPARIAGAPSWSPYLEPRVGMLAHARMFSPKLIK